MDSILAELTKRTHKSNLIFTPTTEVTKSFANKPGPIEANTDQINAVLNKHKIKFSAIDERYK